MAKAIAMLTVFSYCSYLGFAASGRLRRRERFLCALRDSVKELLFHMGQTRLPLCALLLSLGQSPARQLMRTLGEALSAGASIDAAWEGAKAELGRAGALSDLTQSDMEALDRFFPSLGKTDLAGQQENGRLLLRYLSEACAAAGEEQSARGKLYRALGPLMGAAAAVLML